MGTPKGWWRWDPIAHFYAGYIAILIFSGKDRMIFYITLKIRPPIEPFEK
jgi:hypothetical protein